MPLKKRRGGSLGNKRPKKACATLKKVTVISPEAACAHISSDAGTSHLLNDEEEVEWIDGPVSGPWQDISAAIDEDNNDAQLLLEDKSKRIGIAFVFQQMLGGPADEKEWTGQSGVIPKLRKMLSLPKGTCLKPLLRDVNACREMGVPYTGERRISEDLGRPPSIALDSIEAQIIADCCEDGMSIELTRATVNEHCRQNGESSFTLAPIYRVSRALKPKKCRIKKRNQGSEDKQSAWCLARKGWFTLLLIRTGSLSRRLTP